MKFEREVNEGGKLETLTGVATVTPPKAQSASRDSDPPMESAGEPADEGADSLLLGTPQDSTALVVASKKGKPSNPRIRKATDAPLPEPKRIIGGVGGNGGVTSPLTLAGLKLLQKGALIKIERLVKSQIRVKGENPRQVARFGEMYLNGEPFPAVTVIKVEDGRLILSDGHQRCLGVASNGGDKIAANVFEGTESDAIKVGLELNCTGIRLTPEDVVRAAVMQKKKGVKVNISELARAAGVCRATARKKYREELAITGGVLDGTKYQKPLKTPQEIGEALAAKAADMIEDGKVDIINLIFDKLSDDFRVVCFAELQRRFANTSARHDHLDSALPFLRVGR